MKACSRLYVHVGIMYSNCQNIHSATDIQLHMHLSSSCSGTNLSCLQHTGAKEPGPMHVGGKLHIGIEIHDFLYLQCLDCWPIDSVSVLVSTHRIGTTRIVTVR